MYIRFAVLIALLWVGAAKAADDPNPEVIVGAGISDFTPVAQGTTLWTKGQMALLAGVVPGIAQGSTDAALVAVNVTDGAEIWRGVVGGAERDEEFLEAAVARQFACALGVAEDDDGDGGNNVIVACFQLKTGEVLWQREFEAVSDPGVDLFAIGLAFAGRRLLVEVNDGGFPAEGISFFASKIVLSLDVRDGS
jgi:outer membrane protein assembly factor BamB